MIPNRHYFQISFPSSPAPISDVWRTLVSCLRGWNCLPQWFYVSQIAGHPEIFHSEERLKLTPEEIASLAGERGLKGFSVNTGYGTRSIAFQLSNMKELGNQSIFDCRISEKAPAPDDWTKLIEAIMIQWPCIGGWQWDHLYRVWQWACTVDGYERNFGVIPPETRIYPQKDVAGMSPDREMVDISKNPGRIRDLIPGIYFVPTAEMWLGPHFWQYAKCTKEEVLAADFFLEKRDTPHFLYLKSWPQPFTRPDGEQGRQQQRLWKLLFHEDCEWPPGSGTIRDEPMYGPPELMP